MSSMKYPYRDLGVPFDRKFRNDLNANFDDIEHDIRMIGGEAAQQALEAAEEANTQAIYAQTSGDYANDKGDYAAQQGDYAQTQGNFANEKGLYAQQQGDYAKAQGDYAKQVGDENKTRWLTAVNTYTDIATTYPNPQLGDTVQTIDDSKIYRWDGTQWVWTQQYNANAITDVQNKIGILSEKEIRSRTFKGEKFPVFISHNGVNYIAPINTLPAFELAGEIGYKYMEADLRTTLDDVWVVFHDDTVDAMTDGTGPLSSKTLSEVKSLNVDTNPAFVGTKIPTLDEFLSICVKWKAIPILEIKTYNNDENLSTLINLLKDYGFLTNCIIMSFTINDLVKIRNLDKDIPLCVLSNNATQTEIDNAKLIESDYVSINKAAITKDFCGLAHANGLKVGAWTIDDEIEARNLISMGVDIITTNSLVPR